ncbi:uncharacterized protein LOC114245132 isoform X1 [Bombyx mandarina]|uniref:Uncharacterized protein LOC114245132 isoform X1 n=1 Tax=Bombyx mandarina TaxID=7092 RepID=A0A6J2JTN3_BOMMA|nr:uncharacterized protein LOC114245132 isoform X1 [Bombyx mandarina]XP_028032955.1 uncharacterized protein LOC114245132 isoform X1 [Bombyx mandarina]
MPGAQSVIKPASAGEFSASDEESQLQVYLEQQLEEDVARIFDESIYSDIELVCGKLKILTHSCILETRTRKFYHELKNILHVNFGRDSYDEIYSFISDIYTECDIQEQEKEIISYLSKQVTKLESLADCVNKTKIDLEEVAAFEIPDCSISSYPEKAISEITGSSPSTELTKEYYALVPIADNLLEKELDEQDALSNAFISIKKTQIEDKIENKASQPVKPTSLSLSSHISKSDKHSASCDITCPVTDNGLKFEKNHTHNPITRTSQETKSNQYFINSDHHCKHSIFYESTSEKIYDIAYSPDSLIADDPSSSSDYLSATFTCSPVASCTGCHTHLNVYDSNPKMDNIITISDSGMENTGMLESLSSHKDVTLTDISLTESTLHDSVADEASNSNDSAHSPLLERRDFLKLQCRNAPQSASSSGISTDKESYQTTKPSQFKELISGRSSKEEKQRQNEEIVILESSSLSSETGSWESVFPPKVSEKKQTGNCSKTEHELLSEDANTENPINKFSTDIPSGTQYSGLAQKSVKTTSCFIDAASLVEEESDAPPPVCTKSHDLTFDTTVPQSRPVPCSTNKIDMSPNDWSESNDNDDSLEQTEQKDLDSIQKDLSPTIFEMTPITEDSLCTKAFVEPTQGEETVDDKQSNLDSISKETICLQETFMTSTPNNSIMSVKDSGFHGYSEDEAQCSSINKDYDVTKKIKAHKFFEYSPIVSGGASVEDFPPQMPGSKTGSPSTKRKIENIPIVSGGYIPERTEEVNQVTRSKVKLSSSSAWVVDMSGGAKLNSETSNVSQTSKRPNEKTCENLKVALNSNLENCNKSRSSVDSDSSEKSSHKFYIDLASLPDPLPCKKSEDTDSLNEKKNIFTMYIDIGENGKLKEMPPRLSLNTKKNASTSSNGKCEVQSKSVVSEESDKHKPLSNLSTFEKLESLCNDPNISILEIIKIPEKKSSDISEVNDLPSIEIVKEDNSKIETSSLRSITATIQEEVVCGDEINDSSDLFVKLSDLDKPVTRMDIDIPVTKKTLSASVSEDKTRDSRMTRSIPDNNWTNQTLSVNSRSIDIISSFHSENALSLNRLFPHLKNEFSRSVPVSLSSRTRSPLRLGTPSSTLEALDQTSDTSEVSSVQSSMCRSVVENSTTEESCQTSSLIGSCQSRLGQDLLRMFLEEIAPDVVVEVSGKRIKAHKCILSSRCQFFAGILSGGWVESAGNVIALPSFSYNVVHFAMCHIYSGLSAIPDTISILELATLADMLGLEGLKEAIMFTLKTKYCHHFHRPCPVCVAGVLECFPLSSAYGLDDLYRKCLRWITKYFIKVWPTKAFATLPSELIEKCYQQHVVNLSTDNLVDTVYGCSAIVASLQNIRWAETVARLCRRLVNAAAHFAAPRLVAVLQDIANMAPDAPPPAKQALMDCIAAAIEWAPPDEGCRAYALLSDLVRDIKLHSSGSNNLLHSHAANWRMQCEGALVRAAPRVVGTQAFQDLPTDLRRRLRELGCIMYGTQAIPVTTSPYHERKSRSTYHNKASKTHNTKTSRSLDIDHVRASFVPYAPKPATHISSVDILKNVPDLKDAKKLTTRTKPPKVRTTKAQEERAKYNMTKNIQSVNQVNGKTGHPPIRTFENTKPRYLEPRPCKENDKKTTAPNKLVPKMVSSSESSRNSSPIQVRNLRTTRMKTRQGLEVKTHAMSQDSLATSSRPRTAEPSTDSLSESQNSNKYATYTKIKHSKGSIESIKSRCHNVTQPTINTQCKIKTKIPVSLNQNYRAINTENKSVAEAQKRSPGCPATNGTTRPRMKSVEKKITGSLMNATKSSSAKIVPKVIKESHTNKCPSKSRTARNSSKEHEAPAEIPLMERSGTFLKDEPTFGDKTTNIDID